MISGFSAILLPQLEDPKSEIQVTTAQASWIASMAALPMAFGCVIGGYIMERYGRKLSHLIPCAPLIFGWLLIYLARDLQTLLWGRFFTGLASGILAPPSSVYIGETSAPKYRGFLLVNISLAMSVGLLVTHLLGTYFTWKTTTIVCALLPCLAMAILVAIPESPSWLATQGRLEEAITAFLWCRGHSVEAKEELLAMLERQRAPKAEPSSKSIRLKDLKRPEFLKPLVIINMYLLITQFCGVNAISFYTVSIMHDTMGDTFDEYTAMLIIDGIRVVSSIISCILLRHIGRRPTTIISGIGTAISLIALSSFIYISSSFPFLAHYSSIPLLALIGYIGFITLGLVPLPWAMLGEVFPLNQRGIGSGISSTLALVAIFLVVKTTPSVFALLGTAGSFMLYGTVACLGTAYLWWFLPETKDRTLQEIEESWKRKEDENEVTVVKELEVVV